jgi:hypothetical protein
VSAYFGGIEPSMDFDWIRVRLTASTPRATRTPTTTRKRGFDAIFENPQFAGSDTSYWIRQTIPFAGGGRVISINSRNGVLNALRSSKDEGQSNFNNPARRCRRGARLRRAAGAAVDDQLNHLGFVNTAILQACARRARSRSRSAGTRRSRRSGGRR